MEQQKPPNPQLEALAKILEVLHREWRPHRGQIDVGAALFRDDTRRIFIQCGRKWGKSELLMYILLRWALVNEGASAYYIAPFQKQAKEILWQRLNKFIPREFVKSVNRTELRITLLNGSFIKLDGSDNYEAYRGVTPDIVGYDEFKDFRPEFHVAMEPNLAPRNAPLIIAGTPPEYEGQYFELAEEFAMRADSHHVIAPTEQNPHIARAWLDKMHETLIARGELDVWEREYMGRRVIGGSNSIFPMLSREKHVFTHEDLIREINRDISKLEWIWFSDPGTASCFAVLFGALNPYTRTLYLLDEIYETRSQETSTSRIWPRIRVTQASLNSFSSNFDDTWYQGYDEAAIWFQNEVLSNYNVALMPTSKSSNAKESGLSLIKDQLLWNKVKISTRCEKLLWEVTNYIKDPATGKIPKRHDHLIDCWRYMNAGLNYDPNLVKEPIPGIAQDPDMKPRFYTPDNDPDLHDNDDPLKYYED